MTDLRKNLNTTRVLEVMHVLTWIAFIGTMVETGGVLVSYGVSVFNPSAAKNLYMGLDLYAFRKLDFWYYTMSVSFVVALSVTKSVILYFLIKALSKVNLVNPFTIGVSKILEKISYMLVGAAVIAMLNNANADSLLEKTGIAQSQWATGEYFFIAGLVFIIATVFKRGVEIQSENDLTV